MDKTRCSKDSNINNEGRLLLETCKSNNLLILNGRCGKDRGVGSFTYKNTSVIDYTVVSAQILKFISNFEIIELDTLYTDYHCLLNTTVTFTNKVKLSKPREYKKVQKPRWQEIKQSDFILNLSANNIEATMTYLESACQNIGNITKENINTICSSISDIFSESASKSFNSSTNFINQDKKSDHKAWFGPQCQNARRK